MSQENVELARRAVEAWNEDGPESVRRFWADWLSSQGVVFFTADYTAVLRCAEIMREPSPNPRVAKITGSA